MVKYTYILAANTSEGLPLLFQADGAYAVTPGDLVLSDGELFEVVEKTHTEVGGSDWRVMNSVLEIRQAEKIYSVCWIKEENK